VNSTSQHLMIGVESATKILHKETEFMSNHILCLQVLSFMVL